MSMRILKVLFGTATLALAATGVLHAAATGPLTLKAALDKPAYVLAEPVFVTVTLENKQAGDIIAAAGLSERVFERDLVLTRPDGVVLRANSLKNAQAAEPDMQPPVDVPPPVLCRDPNNKPVQCEQVEILYGQDDDAAIRRTTIPTASSIRRPLIPTSPSPGVDITANNEFVIDQTGYWKIQAVVPVRTYSPPVYSYRGVVPYSRLVDQVFEGFNTSNTELFAVTGDADGDGFEWYPVDALHPEDPANPVDCDDTDASINPDAQEVLDNDVDENCDGIVGVTPAAEKFDVTIQVDEHLVGSGKYPSVTTSQIEGIAVRAYDKADPCVQQYDASRWQHRRPLLLQCIPEAVELTGGGGLAMFQLESGNWWFIAVYPPGSSLSGGAPASPNNVASPIYGATGIDNVPDGGVASIIKFTRNTSSGKTVPSSWKKRSGSVLLIVQPEYVEWDGTTAEYPFVFDTVGDWTVTTAVTPPEGFVADETALTADVNSEIEAVQFTITDVGSDWVSTDVEYEVKHKGKTEKIKSKIGVKLSKKLAKQKKLPWWGDESMPALKTVDKKAGKDEKTTREKKGK